MKLKFLFQTLAAALTMLCLSSCDGGGGDGGEANDAFNPGEFEGPERFDLAALNLAPGALAEMPISLLSGDVIEYNPAGYFQPDGANEPTSEGREPWVLAPTPDSPNSFLLQESEFEIRPYLYDGLSKNIEDRDRTNATGIDGAIVNVKNVPLTSSGVSYTGIGADFTVEVAFANQFLKDNESDFINGTNGITDRQGLFDALLDELNSRSVNGAGVSDSAADLAVSALRQLGYTVVEDQGFTGTVGFNISNEDGVNGPYLIETLYLPIRGFAILNTRSISHENISSTNADILNSQKIEGGFTMNESYLILYGQGEAQGTESVTTTLTVDTSFPVLETDTRPATNPTVLLSALGTFVLNLGSL